VYSLLLDTCLILVCLADNDSMAATLVAISPALAHAWLHPNAKKLPEVFTLTALGFFLCSFQVHEKSILLPLLPASLGLFSPDPRDRQWTVWINIIGTISYGSISLSFIAYRISLWPLLKKDGLALQYFIFLPLWAYLSYPLDVTTIIHMVSPPIRNVS
jgi:alpha-1,3-glucosyltransferase